MFIYYSLLPQLNGKYLLGFRMLQAARRRTGGISHSAAPQGLLGPLNNRCSTEGPDPQLVGADPTASAIAAFVLAPVQGLYGYCPVVKLLATFSLCQVVAEEQNEEAIY